MARRKSVRAFLQKNVEQDLVTKILTAAFRAPSGGNMQPWKVHILTGSRKDGLAQALMQAYDQRPSVRKDDYLYYPDTPLSPYTDRISEIGELLYGSLEIGKRDVSKRREQQKRNYQFHGAPVGIVLTMDKRLETGSYVDMGIFISHLILAAEANGLATCVEAALISYADVIRSHLSLPETDLVICGIALGFEDRDHPLNQFARPRKQLEDAVIYYGD